MIIEKAIKQAIKDVKEVGGEPGEVVLGRQMYEALCKEWEVSSIGVFHSLPLKVSDGVPKEMIYIMPAVNEPENEEETDG